MPLHPQARLAHLAASPQRSWQDKLRQMAHLSCNLLGAYHCVIQRLAGETLTVVVPATSDLRYRRKGTDLLETFPGTGGHLTRTAHLLAIHRTTLRQRFLRLQDLCGVDVQQERDLWFALQIVIALTRMPHTQQRREGQV